MEVLEGEWCIFSICSDSGAQIWSLFLGLKKRSRQKYLWFRMHIFYWYSLSQHTASFWRLHENKPGIQRQTTGKCVRALDFIGFISRYHRIDISRQDQWMSSKISFPLPSFISKAAKKRGMPSNLISTVLLPLLRKAGSLRGGVITVVPLLHYYRTTTCTF